MERKTKRRLEMGEDAWKEHQKRREVRKVIRYRRSLKWRFVEEAGGKCKRCGYRKKIPAAYSFHHRNPEDKEFALSQNNFGKPQKVLRKEMAKCDLLCVRCHAEVHYEIEQKKT